ncbi:MAG: hypothetical protein ED559_10955 [Phycisphaera sp.]|nr:MAG: hypothetical protein ED559_10955 [Phycisphaera sp.]
MRSRVILSLIAITLTGCQSGGGGGTTPGNSGADRSRTPQSGPLRPISQTNNSSSSQAEPKDTSWKPSWWFDEATRTTSGSVQACGTATNQALIDARREAIENARASATQLADAGLDERVIQAATNPNAEGGFTVWVVLELGGQ